MTTVSTVPAKGSLARRRAWIAPAVAASVCFSLCAPLAAQTTCGRMYPLPPPGGYSVAAGATVEVTLFLATVPAVGVFIPALDAALTFDPSLLEVASVSFAGTVLSSFLSNNPPPTVNFDNVNGRIGVLFACLACLTGSGGAAGGTDVPFVKVTLRGKSNAGGSTFLRFVNSVNVGAATAETRIFGPMAISQCTRAAGGLVTTDTEIRLNPGTVVRRTVRIEVVGVGALRVNGQTLNDGASLQVDNGASVEFVALPDAANCWRFDRWTQGLSGTQSPQSLTVSSDVTVEATMARDIPCLEGHVMVDGPGAVSLSLLDNDTVRLMATAASAPFFVRWMGAVASNVSSVDVAIAALIAQNVTAVFRDPIAFQRGDVDGNGVRQLSDAVFGLVWLASGGATPPCLDAADVNDDRVINITDFIALLRFLFLGGSAPPVPFVCGEDPTADALGCAQEPATCGV